MINNTALVKGLSAFWPQSPFPHATINDFFDQEIAVALENEFPAYDSEDWFVYQNPVEIKKAQNNWNIFPPTTYQVLAYLTSPQFTNNLSEQLGITLFADPGLHGGGWHIHGDGGLLNPHLDYSIHPKYGLQRRINLIIYLSKNLKEIHGGHLGLWSHDVEANQPGDLITEIAPKFNRAALFDTTQNSWHGLSRHLKCQGDPVLRKSLAVYYLSRPDLSAPNRPRALYAPTNEQRYDTRIQSFMQERADIQTPQDLYNDNITR
jgi:hypothetical protein